MNSMTGFGKGEAREDGVRVSVTIRAVNHRYLDFSIRMPTHLLGLETALRQQVSNRISRGRLEIYVDAENAADGCAAQLNRPLAAACVRAASEAASLFGIRNDVTASTLLALPDMLVAEPDQEEAEHLRKLLSAACAAALDGLCAARSAEGTRLQQDISGRLGRLSEIAAGISDRAGGVVAAYSQRLSERAATLMENGIELDPDRLAQEVALYADRCDVTEELVRIDSHLEQCRSRLQQKSPAGKHLDFLLQELNREFNTIGSKSQDREISTAVIEAKAELEKIREQIQNVE